MILVVYDITSPSRLRKVSKILEKYGIRVQNSTFELDREHQGEILVKLKKIINEEENDKLFVFRISHKDGDKIELAEDKDLWSFVV